jgi:hypothetical protein
MDILEILKKAEEELREAIAEAARAGDYRAVDLGRSVAVGVQELCEKVSGKRQASEKSTEEYTETEERKRHRKIGKRNKPEGLPRIEIRKGSLFRIGWSRKQKREYEHKVPRVSFDTIVNTMSALAREGKGPFMAESVLEKISATKEDMIPVYQVYVVLAALREWNIITQVGREGYNISPDISEKANQVWREMADKRSNKSNY